MNSHPSTVSPWQEESCTIQGQPGNPQIPEKDYDIRREEGRKRLAECIDARISATVFLQYLQSLAAFLEKFHKSGYICLNLCPDTVVCTEDGTALLSEDCPINSKSAFIHVEKERWNLPPQTAYTAPELLCFKGGYFDRRRIGNFGHRADIYSLGLMLCQYLFGCSSMTGGERQRILKLITRPLQKSDLSSTCRDIPDDVTEEIRLLLQKMLANISADRINTMKEVEYGIRSVLAKLG